MTEYGKIQFLWKHEAILGFCEVCCEDEIETIISAAEILC